MGEPTRTAVAAAAAPVAGESRAAVDVGSNSVRLLVADGEGRRIVRRLEVTRLATGVDATGHLDDAALARTLAVIGAYRDEWRALGVDGRVRIAATSAVRDAADRERFFAGVRSLTGIDAEVLSGEQEAALAYAGALRATPSDGRPAVVDIGGGSTELVLGDAGVATASVSLQLGCVRLAERYLAGDPPAPSEVVAAQDEVAAQLDHAERVLADQGASLADATGLIGVAGTVTTVAALHLGLDRYDEDRIHGTRVPADALTAIARQLMGMTTAQRARLGAMQPGREDVIHGGALILAAIVERGGFGEVVASESDGLDGLVASLA